MHPYYLLLSRTSTSNLPCQSFPPGKVLNGKKWANVEKRLKNNLLHNLKIRFSLDHTLILGEMQNKSDDPADALKG